MINALRRKQRGIISYPRPSCRGRHWIEYSSLDTGFRRYDEVAASPW